MKFPVNKRPKTTRLPPVVRGQIAMCVATPEGRSKGGFSTARKSSCSPTKNVSKILPPIPNSSRFQRQLDSKPYRPPVHRAHGLLGGDVEQIGTAIDVAPAP